MEVDKIYLIGARCDAGCPLVLSVYIYWKQTALGQSDRESKGIESVRNANQYGIKRAASSRVYESHTGWEGTGSHRRRCQGTSVMLSDGCGAQLRKPAFF